MRSAIFALFLASAACAKHSAPLVPHTTATEDLAQKTVALVETQGTEARAFCSGVWVGQESFLTAAHCVEDQSTGDPVSYMVPNDLRPAEGDIAAVRIGDLSALDKDHDLALVRARVAPEHVIARVAQHVVVGQAVQTMGHPLGLWWSYSTGVVSALRALESVEGKPAWWVQTTAPLSPGNSGGGLFDEAGDLLGVCHASLRRGQNVNLFVHLSYIDAFLKSQGPL
jgi:S1-C subfamily serine protease